MCRRNSVLVVGPWDHVYFCVGVRLTGLTLCNFSHKLAVSEPVPMASFIIRNFCNKM